MVLQVGVKAFLKNSEGKYLLLHRSPVKYPGTRGTWDIPGGRIEIGTPRIDNLRREVKEETQLELASEPILLAAQDIMPPSGEKHVVRLTYVARAADGTPTLDTEENVEYQWLSLAGLRKQDDVDIYVRELLDGGLLSQLEI